MTKPVTRLLAEKLTDGGVSALARILGVTVQTVQRWNSGARAPGPVVEYLSALFDEFSGRVGNEEALSIFHEAARRLGREPEDKRLTRYK